MGCSSCGSKTDASGQPAGCGSKGNCLTSSCNKMSTFDWLSHLGIDDPHGHDIVEISFKDGATKDFYHAPPDLRVFTGDMVAVEARNGYNIGRITLSGELVRLQMKKKRVRENKVVQSVLRKANERDLEKLAEMRAREPEALVRARAIVRTSHTEMKITDIEYQGDGKKMTIFYTCDDRVDFRELVRQFSHQFRVKIEMRQISPRVESGRIGGIGSCGRELCCSTWLSDFKPVNTAAARYQNLAINQPKLSGQCGRLKCCLNYELDTYMEATENFPKKADKLPTKAGTGILIKTDIFKGIMYYTYRESRGLLFSLPVEKVHEILKLIKSGETVADLQSYQVILETSEEDSFGYEDVTGVVELPASKPRKRNRRKKSSSSKNGQKTTSSTGETKSRKPRRNKRKAKPKTDTASTPEGNRKKRKSRNRRRRKSGKPNNGGNGSNSSPT